MHSPLSLPKRTKYKHTIELCTGPRTSIKPPVVAEGQTSPSINILKETKYKPASGCAPFYSKTIAEEFSSWNLRKASCTDSSLENQWPTCDKPRSDFALYWPSWEIQVRINSLIFLGNSNTYVWVSLPPEEHLQWSKVRLLLTFFRKSD